MPGLCMHTGWAAGLVVCLLIPAVAASSAPLKPLCILTLDSCRAESQLASKLAVGKSGRNVKGLAPRRLKVFCRSHCSSLLDSSSIHQTSAVIPELSCCSLWRFPTSGNRCTAAEDWQSFSLDIHLLGHQCHQADIAARHTFARGGGQLQ